MAFSRDELAALELFHQLVNLSPDDGRRAVLASLRLPSGRLVGEVWLSPRDVELLSNLAVVKRLEDDAVAAAELLADEDAFAAVGDEAEAFLRDGGDV